MRTLDGSAEGRVVRGYKPLRIGMKVPVKLVSTDSVHGFIDFEYSAAIDRAKEERKERKRGRKGFKPGAEISVVLWAADPVRGFIDLAREDTVLPGG